jgi:hypothetical protein
MADLIVRGLIAEPEFASLAANVNALRNDLKARGSLVHLDGNLSADATPVAADLPTLITRINALKALYNLHIARADAHVAADATNANATTVASDLATSITLANALKVNFNAHCAQAGVHINNDAGTIATANGTVLADTITLCNSIGTTLNAHMAKIATSTAIVRGAP